MYRALPVVLALLLWTGGCEVEATGFDPVNVKHSGKVEIPNEIEIIYGEASPADVLRDHDFAVFVETDLDGWLRRCPDGSDVAGALWIRPPAGCGAYVLREACGDWCVGYGWAGCP